MKRRYSLTAKERKQLNKGEPEKDNHKKDKPLEEVAPEIASFDDGAPASGEVAAKSKRSPLVIIVAIFMIALVLTGIVVTILLIDEMGKPQGNPVATITLNTGDKLEFVLYEDTAPFAVTNFMFLSMKGFFNDTVFHDNQNDWLRFMGMVDYDTHRSQDENYCKSFTGFDKYDYEWGQEQNSKKNIFWYRVKNDSMSIKFDNEANTQGLLCFQYSSSSCLYQISAVNNPNTRINKTDRKTFTVMGRYANDSTLETLQRLNVGKDNATFKSPWYNPNTVITIKNIKISNYDKEKWEGTGGVLSNFDTYMAQIGGYSSHLTSYNSILS